MKRVSVRAVRSLGVMFVSLSFATMAPRVAVSEPEKPEKPEKAEKTELRFPALLTGPCKRDADCDHSYTYAMPNGRCCSGTCSPKGLPLSTIERIVAYCKKAGWEEERCPTKKCAQPPPVKCVDGSCQLITSERR